VCRLERCREIRRSNGSDRKKEKMEKRGVRGDEVRRGEGEKGEEKEE
jgi:hypothetical protein